MIIKNAASLGTTLQRRQALALLESGYQAITMQAVLRSKIARKGTLLLIEDECIDLGAFRHIGVVGIGKCALEAGQYLERVLGKYLWGGIVLDVKKGKTKKLTSIAGTHPLPSEKNKQASERIIKFAKSLDPKTDLLLCIVSGGGSSLFLHSQGISVANMVKLTNDLHKSGATIEELNSVRKHLSSVQGGKFAHMLAPLPVVGLYFSDVVAKDPEQTLCTIASGPLCPDTTTSAYAQGILKTYGLAKKYKAAIARWDETPKRAQDFSHVRNYLLLSNRTMLDAMARRAKALGVKAMILTHAFAGDANSAFLRIRALTKKHSGYSAYLVAGETTVRVRGAGAGGRNQQSCLAALSSIEPGELFLSAASDGHDNTDHAGAIADAQTVMHATKHGLDARAFLSRNDSYGFFEKTKDFIITGLTGSNVSDVMIYMKTRNRAM